jgi:hypothetical protein
MTSLWGPLGWMTLHSISLLYPESPSDADRKILKRFMDLFRDTITCPHCHQHFKIIFINYINAHPEWSSSRFDFFMFVVRAHNTVNKRLNKPKPESVQECLDMYASNTKNTTGLGYRTAYLNYLMRNYGREMSGEGYMRLAEVREMKKITEEYWNRKSDESTTSFNMDANVLEFINENASTRQIMLPGGSLAEVATKNFNIGFRGGRFQLRK